MWSGTSWRGPNVYYMWGQDLHVWERLNEWLVSVINLWHKGERDTAIIGSHYLLAVPKFFVCFLSSLRSCNWMRDMFILFLRFCSRYSLRNHVSGWISMVRAIITHIFVCRLSAAHPVTTGTLIAYQKPSASAASLTNNTKTLYRIPRCSGGLSQ